MKSILKNGRFLGWGVKMKEEDITQVIYKVSFGRTNYEFKCNKVGTVVVNNEIKDFPIKDDIWKISIKEDGKN